MRNLSFWAGAKFFAEPFYEKSQLSGRRKVFCWAFFKRSLSFSRFLAANYEVCLFFEIFVCVRQKQIETKHTYVKRSNTWKQAIVWAPQEIIVLEAESAAIARPKRMKKKCLKRIKHLSLLCINIK